MPKKRLRQPSKQFPGMFESGYVTAIAYRDVEGDWLHTFKGKGVRLLTNTKGDLALMVGPQTRFTDRGFTD